MQSNRFMFPADAMRALVAGNATLTLVSTATSVRYTYKVKKAAERPGSPEAWFVSLLTGSNNERDYTYIGMLRREAGALAFRTTANSKLNMDSVPAKALAWTVRMLTADRLPEALQVWHEGRCCRCGRKLTVPESVASGLGPDCAQVAAAA